LEIVGSQTGPVCRGGREGLKKEADHPRLVGGNFNKQGNLLMRLVLGSCKMGCSPYLPARI